MFRKLLAITILIGIFLVTPGLAAAESPALAFERRVEVLASPTECGAGWNAKGQEIFARCGPGPTYFVTSDAEDAAIVGGIFTHSHPSQYCGPLAADDVAYAARHNIREIRAVHFVGWTITVYSLARRGKSWPNIDLALIGYDPGLQRPDQPMCGWADKAWSQAARIYGLVYSVHQETLKH